MSDFFRFPHTPHIAWLAAGTPRDDKVLSPDEGRALLDGEVVVEEKLDGANMGISFSADAVLRVQNRGQYLNRPFGGQFSRLDEWLAVREDSLFDALGSNLMLFGEWCAAQHSLDYNGLPDWFLAFDVYDREQGRFWSTSRRHALAESLGIKQVPRVLKGHTTLAELTRWVQERDSHYREGSLEGVVIRREDDDWLLSRAKLVRPDFVQSIEEHWRSRALQWNRIAWTEADGELS
ncbi:MAG TPA: RNA ligase family protein [Aquabacterium sp.]|uniref:RNA ligase family protein n=1 Tax=Aquabacterium sp. TaxID=1872578 RepID=UPI002DB3EFCD|nr:RNA ligase family protein [Aquabacterium sp.]HET6786458.1 RNA ligase family protein [Aquabacterium sp.]HEX5371811.1 RNA ligase family protein [Aquabacterium sp.]